MRTDCERRPRLRDQFRYVIRVRHYSPRTENIYWYWFHKLRQPADMSQPEVSVFF